MRRGWLEGRTAKGALAQSPGLPAAHPDVAAALRQQEREVRLLLAAVVAAVIRAHDGDRVRGHRLALADGLEVVRELVVARRRRRGLQQHTAGSLLLWLGGARARGGGSSRDPYFEGKACSAEMRLRPRMGGVFGVLAPRRPREGCWHPGRAGWHPVLRRAW